MLFVDFLDDGERLILWVNQVTFLNPHEKIMEGINQADFFKAEYMDNTGLIKVMNDHMLFGIGSDDDGLGNVE